MRRPPSALAAIGRFGVAVAALSVATTAGIVLLVPDPPAPRVTVAGAVAALRGSNDGFERRAAAPPEGTRAPLIEQLLASELGQPAAGVRAIWLDGPPERVGRRIAVIVPRSPDALASSTSFVLKPRGGRTYEMVVATDATGSLRRLLLAQPQPAFVAGVRGTDGRWVSVAPRRPFVSGWRLKVVAAFAVSLLLLAPLAWIFARRLTRPFRTLARSIDAAGEPVLASGPRELREAAAAIARLRTRLSDEAKERARMLTAVAHDLRTPLTSLRLRIETVPEPQRARMVADADRMQVMIRDVLDFARAADAPRTRVDVRPFLAQVILDMPGADRVLTPAPGPEVSIIVVEQAFRRAVENLVCNAIDYAGGGRVELRRDYEAVVVEVIDMGPGIAARDRKRLLRPFERGEASRNRQTGGAGLGLSIVQSFAEFHGGSLTLGDGPGGGTVATLRLPSA